MSIFKGSGMRRNIIFDIQWWSECVEGRGISNFWTKSYKCTISSPPAGESFQNGDFQCISGGEHNIILDFQWVHINEFLTFDSMGV